MVEGPFQYTMNLDQAYASYSDPSFSSCLRLMLPSYLFINFENVTLKSCKLEKRGKSKICFYCHRFLALITIEFWALMLQCLE